MTGDSHRHEDQGQTAKDQGLDETKEKLQSVKRHRQHHRHQEGGYQKQDFPGHHVAEKTKAKADDADKLAESLKDADGQIDEAEKESTSGRLGFAGE